MRDADEHVTGCTMGKGTVIVYVLLSLLIGSSGASYIQNPLAEHGRFQSSSFRMPGDAYVHPSVSHYVYPGDVISKSEAISIAKANVDFYILYSTTAKLEWIYWLDHPEIPVWVITMKGRFKKSYPADWVTRVVRIDGYTGRVISIR